MKDKLRGIVAELDARPPPLPAGGARRRQGVPVLARRRPFHVPRLPLPRSRHRRRRRTRCGSSPGSSLGILRETGGRERRGELRRAAAGGARVRARARPPDRHQGQRALDRASAGLSRLRRRQALRRRGQGLRRASLPRPVHVDRVQREARRDSAPAAQDRQRHRARRPRAGQPRRQGAASTSSTRIRATSCSRRARTTSARRRWASCTSASGSASGSSSGAIRSSASSSCLIYAPRENYTTELRAEVAGDPACRRSTARAPSSTSTCPSRCWRAC